MRARSDCTPPDVRGSAPNNVVCGPCDRNGTRPETSIESDARARPPPSARPPTLRAVFFFSFFLDAWLSLGMPRVGGDFAPVVAIQQAIDHRRLYPPSEFFFQC